MRLYGVIHGGIDYFAEQQPHFLHCSLHKEQMLIAGLLYITYLWLCNQRFSTAPKRSTRLKRIIKKWELTIFFASFKEGILVNITFY